MYTAIYTALTGIPLDQICIIEKGKKKIPKQTYGSH